MFAMIEVVVSLTPTFISVLSSMLYNATLISMPGAWSLLPISMLIVQFIIHLASYPLYVQKGFDLS
jgi:hypothetical protein